MGVKRSCSLKKIPTKRCYTCNSVIEDKYFIYNIHQSDDNITLCGRCKERRKKVMRNLGLEHLFLF